jgi:hypothetical protein
VATPGAKGAEVFLVLFLQKKNFFTLLDWLAQKRGWPASRAMTC